MQLVYRGSRFSLQSTAIAPSNLGLSRPSTLVYRGMQMIERQPVDEATGFPEVVK